ncbi:MAG: hypothetical protein CFE45_02135 [Burkholderiales bacterium PBB5]|nr:MAG: hypothetical protein CFE45_02135 [Burkholderiales bacterium PBB5]
MKTFVRTARCRASLHRLILACAAALALPAHAVAVANTAPVAVTGGPYVATPGTILLDGSASWDADIPFGDAIVDYSWGFMARERVVAQGARPLVSTYLLYDLAAHAGIGSPIANPITGLPAWSVFLTVTDKYGATNTALTSLRFMAGNYQLPPVPEPEGWALMGAGLGILAWVDRRRNKKATRRWRFALSA